MRSSQLSTVDYLVPDEPTHSHDSSAHSLEMRLKSARRGRQASPPESPNLWMPPADPFNPSNAMTLRTYQPPPQRHNPQLCLPGLKAPQSHGPDEVPAEGGAIAPRVRQSDAAVATAGHGSSASSSTGRSVTLTFSRSTGSDRRQSALLGSLDVNSQDEQPANAGGEEARGKSLVDVSQVTERRVSPHGLTIPTYASRTRHTPARLQNPTEEASSARVDASQQAEASREAELPFPNIQSLQGSPATSQPQYSQFVTTPDGTQPSAYTVQAQPATQESSQPNFEDDIDVLEAQVQILEQVHSCLTKYGPQMPKVAHNSIPLHLSDRSNINFKA